MQRIVFNDYVNAGMCALFVGVVLSMIVFGLIAAWRGFQTPRFTAQEAPIGVAREVAAHA